MSEAPLRVLGVAFAVVPGSSAHSPALVGLAAALHAEMDFVTVRADALPHIERFGPAQMLRVPVGGHAEGSPRSAFCRAIRRQIESESYDVVHVRGPVEGLVALELRASQALQVVYEMGSYPDEFDGPGAEQGWAAAHLRCLEAADRVIVPSEAALRPNAVRARGDRVHVVPPGVDVDAYDWRASGSEAGPDAPTRLLYLGAFATDRDVGTLLMAVRDVARRTRIRALLAGEPDAGRRARVRRLVTDLGLGGVVEVRGEPPALRVPHLIAAADICLAPAAALPRFEEHGDVPQPLLEYFAGKRAVIAAGVPAVGEVLRDGREGLLYPAGDESALAAAIDTLVGSRELREGLAAGGYARVREQLSAGARRRRLAEVYELLAPGSQRRDPWMTGFDAEGTGQWELPQVGSETTGPRPERHRAPHDTDHGVSRASQETEVLLVVGAPEPSGPASLLPPPGDLDDAARFDTSPGAEAPDLPGAPTIIRAGFVTEETHPGAEPPAEHPSAGPPAKRPSAGPPAKRPSAPPPPPRPIPPPPAAKPRGRA
jgi:glycosyltransferase involved in cell wall biosynthesis